MERHPLHPNKQLTAQIHSFLTGPTSSIYDLSDVRFLHTCTLLYKQKTSNYINIFSIGLLIKFVTGKNTTQVSIALTV